MVASHSVKRNSRPKGSRQGGQFSPASRSDCSQSDDTLRLDQPTVAYDESSCEDAHTIDPTTEVCYRCGTPLATIRSNEDENWHWNLEDFEGTPFERFDAVSRALCDADNRIANPTLERCRECSHYWFCFTEQGRKWKDGTARDSEDMRKAEFAVNNLGRILGRR